MKYWFFDGNDVIGPFEPGELAARPGFAATSLVCPEKFSEDQDSWRLAGTFSEFYTLLGKPAPSANPPEPSTDSFDEEMDTLLKQRNPLGVPPDESSTEDPALEIPKKPAKPGPIEDYFNNIQGEDLGNILGIPDPNENSDMDLSRALKTQLGRTTPPADKEIQPLGNDPFDEFTSDDSEKEPLAEDTLEQPSQPAQTDSSSKPQAAAHATQAGAKQTVSKEPDTAGEQAELSKNAEAAPKESVKSDEKKQHTAKSGKPAEPAAALSSPGPLPAQPSSIPISNPGGQDLVLTLHGVSPSAEVPAASAAEQAAAPVLPPEEKETVPSQLPILDEPAANLPPLTEAEPFLMQPTVAAVPPAKPAPSVQEEILSAKPAEESPAPQEPAAPLEKSLNENESVSQPEPKQAAEPLPQKTPEPEELVTKEEEKGETVRQILEDGKLNVSVPPEIKEPIKNVTVEPELNQIRTRLKQTPEIKNFLRQTQNERLKSDRSYKKAMAALSVLIALIAVGAAIYINKAILRHPSEPVPAKNLQEQPALSATDGQKEPAVQQMPDIPVPPPPAEAEPSQADKAIELVKNHPLSGGRGTVGAYFARLYQTQKEQGYTAEWAAEPLHKSTYIVKYRLTKTRMEPIVYIFQADITQGKLTGALNNITLDLVGKIQ